MGLASPFYSGFQTVARLDDFTFCRLSPYPPQVRNVQFFIRHILFLPTQVEMLLHTRDEGCLILCTSRVQTDGSVSPYKF